MSDTVLLSVIVPIYNAEKHLKDCIDSLLCQDFEDNELEIICVNDGSTDNSLKVLEEYSDNPSIRIINKENGGVASARNRGLKEASGRFIAFCDNDDFIEPHYLKKIVSVMIEEQIDTLSFKTMDSPAELNFDREKLAEKIKIITDDKEKIPLTSHMILGWIYSGKIIRENNMCFHEEFRYADDTFFSYDMYLKIYDKKVAYIDNAIYHKRIVPTSLLHSGSRDGIYRHMNDMHIMVDLYRERFDLFGTEGCATEVLDDTQRRLIMATKEYMFDAVRYYDSMYEIKEILKELEQKNLYPYPIPWFNIKSINWKGTVLNCIKLLFPIKIYYLIFCRCMLLFKHITKKYI